MLSLDSVAKRDAFCTIPFLQSFVRERLGNTLAILHE